MRRAGWLIAFTGLVIGFSVWLPWLRTSASGGGRANAIGGATGSVVLPAGFGAGQLILLVSALLVVAGCMVGQHILHRIAPVAAGALALVLLALELLYYRTNIKPPIVTGYGFWVAICASAIAVALAIVALLSRPSLSRSTQSGK
ncbi:putative transmembrane protein [Mycobacteroides abscessus subsp. abscessus]|uniref:Transmembrane protein n=6 Tax=Mycobacteroides abscessus TaxID=36809 RepID=B1MJB6_MYCA9|nr:hypothetical protein [Mycobacteroides abscessus]ETZ88065.1 putative membrane protein [Mycobacteroides abscessus MAB_030201_1075]ETZ92473.1 putative membrane protein [Mycobacteroides abscessus MAB_030201_1061]EUA48929.1 putative membrane protein [Mycobacteroides abscessus 21]EUA64823.1 putative membrane protein [Mycobacteroides abscessus 1948]AKP57132.1 membrane protein [Mycobacteroides abscessus UC22]